MPATAGRVRMPANNRVHSSAALQTHGIWQSAIGYDPYAPQKDESKDTTQNNNTETGGENAYLSFQGLLQLAKITNNTDNEVRGACKKCGRVGHLTFQCKNFVSLKDEIKNKDMDVDALGGLGKVRARKGKGRVSTKGGVESSEESSEDESESSDSSVDSEMERIIAERFGKKKKKESSGKVRSVRKKKDESDDEDSDDGERKKRGRSKKRSSRKRSESDSDEEDDGRRSRRKEKRRKRDELSEDEERRRRSRKSRKEKSRRRSHRHSDDSDESPRRHKRKNRRASPASGSDVSESDDSRVGRDAKRAVKQSHKRHHEKN